MSTETKKGRNRLILVAFVATVLFVVTVSLIFLLGVGKKEEKTVSKMLYDDALQLVQHTQIPTYFDDAKKNPIHNAYLSSTLVTEPTKDEKGKFENVESDVLMDLIFYDEVTSQTINYTVVDYNGEYEYVVNNGGEKVVLENEQEVYKYQSGYFWKLTDDLYASVFSHDENPDEAILEKIIESVGDSKLNVFKQMEFDAKTTVIEPNYTMVDEQNYAYSVVMEYTQVDEKPISTLSLYYDNFVMYQSYDVDYTGEDFMGDYTEETFEKIEHNGVSAFIDKEYHSIHFTTKNELSMWLLPNGEETNVEEMKKVFQSIEL